MFHQLMRRAIVHRSGAPDGIGTVMFKGNVAEALAILKCELTNSMSAKLDAGSAPDGSGLTVKGAAAIKAQLAKRNLAFGHLKSVWSAHSAEDLKSWKHKTILMDIRHHYFAAAYQLDHDHQELTSSKGQKQAVAAEVLDVNATAFWRHGNILVD